LFSTLDCGSGELETLGQFFLVLSAITGKSNLLDSEMLRPQIN
jgi:hypothetical protein